jgi:hypothetical protein
VLFKRKSARKSEFFVLTNVIVIFRKKAAAELPPDPEAEEQKELEEIDELIRNAAATEKSELKK